MLNVSNIIPELISNSQDAQLNLFDVSFVLINPNDVELGLQNSLTVRTSVFNTPSFQENLINVSYMNTSLQIPSPGISINRSLQLQLRLDDQYQVVSFLRNRILGNEDADYERDDNKLFDLIVYAYNAPSPVGNDYYLQPVYQWHFYNCYLTSIPSLSYSYQSAAQGTFMLTIVYNRYEEGEYTGEA